MLYTNSLFIYFRLCPTSKVIFIYSNIKTYLINSNNQNDHVRVSVSSSSSAHVYDVSNIHVKSFYLHHMRSSRMSRGTV